MESDNQRQVALDRLESWVGRNVFVSFNDPSSPMMFVEYAGTLLRSSTKFGGSYIVKGAVNLNFHTPSADLNDRDQLSCAADADGPVQIRKMTGERPGTLINITLTSLVEGFR